MKARPSQTSICFGLLLALVMILAFAIRAPGVPASPLPYEITQPDGTRIQLHIRGDEWFNWEEDTNGFTVVKTANGYFYATTNSAGALVATSNQVGKVNPAAVGLARNILPPPSIRVARRLAAGKLAKPISDPAARLAAITSSPRKGGTGPHQNIVASGTVKNLVILCQFADQTDGSYTRSASDFNILFNQVGGDPTLSPGGSVRDYFYEVSYNRMILDSTIVGWVTLPHPQSYYGAGESGGGTFPQNAQGMVYDALVLVTNSIDFSQFDRDNDGYVDAIDFIHSGYGAEAGAGKHSDLIWSKMWGLPNDFVTPWKNASNENVKVNRFHTEPALRGSSGNSITTIGVICHETGHFFGLPDLYDTDYSSSGIGSWCLMANHLGGEGSGKYPPHPSAWCKIQLGWVTPTLVGPFQGFAPPAVETHGTVYKLPSGAAATEYFLFENRAAYGFDNHLPGNGIAVWHIDEAQTNGNTLEGYPGMPGGSWPQNGQHYKVRMVQRDGDYDLEKKNNEGDSGDIFDIGSSYDWIPFNYAGNNPVFGQHYTIADGYVIPYFSGNDCWGWTGTSIFPDCTYDHPKNGFPDALSGVTTGYTVHLYEGTYTLSGSDTRISKACTIRALPGKTARLKSQ